MNKILGNESHQEIITYPQVMEILSKMGYFYKLSD
jgi:hypothetical protein